jgi:TPP-dependent pyruvate/acetoin dehydrogenase alpha subunit
MDRIDKEVADEVAAALEFARTSAPPPPEAAFTHLFTNPIGTAP